MQHSVRGVVHYHSFVLSGTPWDSVSVTQARLNAGTVAVHEPVVFASSADPTAACRGGVLHSSGRPASSHDSFGRSSDSPDSRGGASPVNTPVESGAACDALPGRSLQVNVNAGPGGRIDVRTRSWMDGLRDRMREREAP